MLEYFLYRRHGSISIMLSFLLIVILSLSSTMMETARYRSTHMLLEELEQNAAFSLLGYYDRDLYKNFGLLAMDTHVGEQQLRRYLDQNMNGADSGMDLNGVDTMLAIGEIKVDKLYDLAQNEVFRDQVMEFSAYRAPVRLASNMADLEDIMKDLKEKLEEAVPLLETFRKLADCLQKIIDTFTKLDLLIDAAKDFQKKTDDYKKAVGEFNNAVSARDKYKDNHTHDEEGYADQLASLNTTVKNKASALKEKISDVKKSMGTYYEKYNDFNGAYEGVMDAEVDTLISGAMRDADKLSDKKTRDNTKQMLEDMKKGFDGAKDLCNSVVSQMDTLYEGFIASCQDALTVQIGMLEGNPEDMGSITVVETLADGAILIIIVRTVVGLAKVLIELVEGWNKSIAKIGDMINVMKAKEIKGLFEPEYNNYLGGDVWNSLPGVSNGGKLKEIRNPYASSDEKLVEDKLSETSKIAESLDYDIRFLEPGVGPVEESALEIAMEEMKKAGDAFQEKCGEMGKASNVFNILSTLMGIVTTLSYFLDRVINLINVFISCVSSDFSRMLYQKMWGAVYANEMFSNRTTDTSEDKKLNNSSFPDFTSFMLSIDNECFDMANTEYILGGTQSEIENQLIAFVDILAMRVLCNIPAVLADQELVNLVGELCAVPVVGWIAALIVVCIMFFIEAWADMIFMIYTDEGVDIIKSLGYFTLDGSGINKLEKKVEQLMGSMADNKNKDEKKNEKSEEKDSSKWDYKDHMQVMLLLFVPNAKLNSRCADLIEMQMRQIKKMKGDADTFHLADMTTYARIHVKASYRPVLPIPVIPGLNDQGIYMESIHYTGY